MLESYCGSTNYKLALAGEFRAAFKNGTATEDQIFDFQIELDQFVSDTSKLYIDYFVRKDMMSKAMAEKQLGVDAFTGEFKYIEELYGRKLETDTDMSNAVIITIPKKKNN